MNPHWEYVPFEKLFIWKEKSKIKSGDGKSIGKYKMFVCSDTEIKRYDEYIEKGESLVFGTGGKASCHFVDEPFAYSTDCVAAQRKSENILTKFYYYYFRQNHLGELQRTFTGSGLQHTSKKKISKIMVPVLSFDEQNLIVTLIEELLSQLDASVAELQAAKKRLKVYRQAVLKEAFFTDGATKIVEISEIVDEIRIGPFGTMLHKSDYITGGIPVINPQHIKNNSIIPSATVTIPEEKANELSAYKLNKNDIIMGRRGEMGRTAPVTDNEHGWICGTGSILLRLKPDFDAVFYSQILSSPDVVHYLEEHATGTTMKNLNEDIVQHIPVPYITIEIQKQMNAYLDKKMSVCDSIEQTVDAALLQAEALRQSILKQAFEGKL